MPVHQMLVMLASADHSASSKWNAVLAIVKGYPTRQLNEAFYLLRTVVGCVFPSKANVVLAISKKRMSQISLVVFVTCCAVLLTVSIQAKSMRH